MPDATPFSTLDAYISIPQVQALALSPDGSRVVLQVATLSPDRTRFVNALWAVDAAGDDGAGADPVRLTRSAKGESGVWFTPAGDILFVSARPDGETGDGDGEDVAQVWRLPAGGGEARPVTGLAGGAAGVTAVAADSERIAITAPLLHSSASVDEDRRRRSARRERKVSAILHQSYPVRYWDHDLGPHEPHLLALDLGVLSDALEDPVAAGARAGRDEDDDGYPERLPQPLDLTPHPGRTVDDTSAVLTPDGRTLIASIEVPRARGGWATLVAVDMISAQRTTLLSEPGVHFTMPVINHAGDLIACVRSPEPTPDAATPQEVWVVGVDGSGAHRIAADWDRYPAELAFAADDRSLLAIADENGRAPIFRLSLDGLPARRITDGDFAHNALTVDRTSGALFALRNSPAVAPHPVRIDPDGTVTELSTPAAVPPLPGRMEEVETTAEDGMRIRGWLALPDGVSAAQPAPLLLWTHGGPVSSWNRWSWRWNPWLAVARGYAVLLTDPGLSSGYGLDFVSRGWNAWGQEPYTDLMAITDAVQARADIDQTRTGEMGGSFGGYMSNWIAGHTDRFRAIVTHASLWALDAFQGTTDRSDFWDAEFTLEGSVANSPHRFVEQIVTPMLVIHGDRDYRVPIGEGLRLWSDLLSHHAQDDGTTVHRYLYFPDENHWILTPQNAIVWYETVFAFLAQHVLGQPWERPEHLG